MLLFGCLLAFFAAFVPRVVLILAWIFSPRWAIVWQGDWFSPLLGIIFVPYTTIMYLLVWDPIVGITGWDWMWIILGLILDVMKWSQIINNRRGVPGYPKETQTTSPSAADTPQTIEPEQQAVETTPPTQTETKATTSTSAVVTEAQLAKLAELHDKGVLTDEEYTAKKKQLEA